MRASADTKTTAELVVEFGCCCIVDFLDKSIDSLALELLVRA